LANLTADAMPDASNEAEEGNHTDLQGRPVQRLESASASLSIDDERVDNMGRWTDDQLANYETALETIGNVIAIASRDIAEEREKIQPDVDRITKLLALQERLNQERNCLRINDDTVVRKATEIHSKIVRAGRLSTTMRGSFTDDPPAN
jgi:hypothetical protein